MNKLPVIYVTGLSDEKITWQQRAVNTWGLWNVDPYVFQVHWADNKSFNSKLDKLLDLIDTLYKSSGQPVGIVAASAGVSMGLHAFAKRRNTVRGLVSICGEIGSPQNIDYRIRKHNPAFGESMDRLSDSLAKLDSTTRKRILCLRPLTDHIVPLKDQRLEGAQNTRVWSVGHVLTIATQLSVGAPLYMRFLKR